MIFEIYNFCTGENCIAIVLDSENIINYLLNALGAIYSISYTNGSEKQVGSNTSTTFNTANTLELNHCDAMLTVFKTDVKNTRCIKF